MNRRFTHTFASPRLTGGDERPTPACAGNWTPYETLMDTTSGPEHSAALTEAKRICGTCPLQVSCLSSNAKAGEPWARTLLGLNRTDLKPPRSTVSPERRARQQKRDELRHDALVALVGRGATLDEALAWVGMAPKGLYSWCRRNGHLDLWRSLNSNTGADQHEGAA